jgi:hypothetical protein
VTLSRIEFKNIQSLKDGVIDLPRTGLIRFRGENNNGKSILAKTLDQIIKGTLGRSNIRNPLINYGSSWGELILHEYNGKKLTAHIDREAKNTYLKLEVPNSDPIIRYPADKNFLFLVKQFGWHYNEKREISLNLYNTFDPLFLVTTSAVCNYDVLSEAISDPYADRAIEGMDRNLQELDGLLKSVKNTIVMAEAKMGGLRAWDTTAEQKKKITLEYYAKNILALSTPDIPDFKVAPSIKNIVAIDVTKVLDILRSLHVVKDEIADLLKSITTIGNSMSSINKNDLVTMSDMALEIDVLITAIREEICPTCGRSFEIEESSGNLRLA